MPIAEAAADRIVSLPMNPHLTSESVETVCATLSEILLRNERLSAAGRKHAAE
jgi:dTDP-4-amino-4,6-dideoxygalactose transaminase